MLLIQKARVVTEVHFDISTVLTYVLLHLHAVNVLRCLAAELQRDGFDVGQGLFCRAAVRSGVTRRTHVTFEFVWASGEDHSRAGVYGYDHLSTLYMERGKQKSGL